jgi:hypothetical protein
MVVYQKGRDDKGRRVRCSDCDEPHHPRRCGDLLLRRLMLIFQVVSGVICVLYFWWLWHYVGGRKDL